MPLRGYPIRKTEIAHIAGSVHKVRNYFGLKRWLSTKRQKRKIVAQVCNSG